MKRGIIILFVFVLLVGIGSVDAIDLYVDKDSINGACSDTYTRTTNTITTPFCTISRANTEHLGGDTVYILPGEYRDKLLPQPGTSPTQRTVFSGLGTREEVKVLGSDLLTGWTKCDAVMCPGVNTNVYFTAFSGSDKPRNECYPLGTGPTYFTCVPDGDPPWDKCAATSTDCFEDRTKWYTRPDLNFRSGKFDGSNQTGINTSGQYYFDYLNSRLYLWPFNSDDANAHMIECSVRKVAAINTLDNPQLAPFSNLVFENLTIMHSFHNGIYMSGSSQYVDIINNEFMYNSGEGGCGENPASIIHHKSGPILRPEINIIGNKFHDEGSDRGPNRKDVESVHAGSPITMYDIRDSLIANNEIYEIADGIHIKSGSSPVSYENITTRNNKIYNVTNYGICYSYAAGSPFSGVIEDNLIYNMPKGFGICTLGLNNNLTIRGNTIINSKGIVIEKDQEGGSNISIYNNIVTDIAPYGGISSFISLMRNIWPKTIADYNLFYNTTQDYGITDVDGYWGGVPAVRYFTFDSWKAGTGLNANSIEADPQILSNDPSSLDFLRPAPGSPAIDNGTWISGYHCLVNYETNPNQQGCKVWYGSAPDMGAYEYSPPTNECDNWATNHPEWIFCDDFENATTLATMYFEYSTNGGEFIPISGVGVNSSIGMRALWQPGEIGAGNLHFGFGRSPVSGSSRSRSTEDFTDVYWRMYLRTQSGWINDNAGEKSGKVSRAFTFASSSWAQAMIAHVWTNNNPGTDIIAIEPVSGVDTSGNLVTTAYNDFANFRWLGIRNGVTELLSTANSNKWYCIEAHAKYNTPGVADGVFDMWINDNLENSRNDLDWVNTWSGYGINAIYLENYWNSPGSPVTQERYMDNFVVSTQRIGCDVSGSPPVISFDVNSDGKVNVIDLSLVVFNQNQIGLDYSHLDVNGDSNINLLDFIEIMLNFG